MKNFYQTLFPAFFLCIFLFSGCTAARTGDRETRINPDKKKEAVASTQAGDKQGEKERVRKLITAALKEAKKTGKTEVNIFLDEDPDIIQHGDVVSVAYSAAIGNGVLMTGEEPVERLVVAGKKTAIPGLDQVLIGLKQNEKKKVTLDPKNAFGVYSDKKIQAFSSILSYPVHMEIPKKKYEERFKHLPHPGEQISLAPYFESKVSQVTDQMVVVENQAEDGHIETAPFGKTTTYVKDDIIYIKLDPVRGAHFPVGKQSGVIVAVKENVFEVDYNHPFAGKKLSIELCVENFHKASTLVNQELTWIDDHDFGLEITTAQNKYGVMVLYADWCSWCEKLFKETFEDPRFKLMKDRFVWIKVNSDKDLELKERYQQKGFPMIVLTGPDGAVLKKISGYKDAESLMLELESMLNPKLAQTLGK